MIQPARVLPSNAPPLGDADNGHHTPRVLQEHSGNRQPTDYSYVPSSEQKYPSSYLTENSYAGYQRPQPLNNYQQSALQRNQLRHSSGRYPFSHDSPEARVRVEKQARYLYHRFRASDQYMKYRNRQQKDDKNGQEQKWPDRLELAFFQALVWWPPMGRRKLPHKDKQRGRNELIADYIEELTGEARTRKQVSSHIQVLKPFVENDPYIMKWLSKDDMGAAAQGRFYGRSSSYHHDGRKMSVYHGASAQTHAVRPPVPPMTQTNSQDLAKVKHELEVFEPVDFQMFVQRKIDDIHQPERLHDYTRATSNPRQRDHVETDYTTFAQDYPFLAAMDQRRRLDCNVVVAETSLAFPSKNFKDESGNSLPGVELGISFLCKSRHLALGSKVQCQNSFYKNGEAWKDHTGLIDVHLTQSEDGDGVETQLKFGSTFWAKQLGFLGAKIKECDDHGKDYEEVKSYIDNITACQEIYVVTDQGHERLLVMYWTFRLSKGVCGRASWTRIKLPPSDQPKTERVDSVYEYNIDFANPTSGALQPSLQSPFEYDSTSGSALTSATWPSTTFDETAPQSAIDFNGDNAFDFTGGNINITYDPSLDNPQLDFSNFDSTAFDFNTTADFVADPALVSEFSHSQSQEGVYSQQSTEPTYSQNATDYSVSQPHWYDSAFDSQQGAANSYSESQSQVFDNAYSAHYDPSHNYSVGPEPGQAYGGAGQTDTNGNVAVKEEDPLAALANASYMAQGHEQE